MWYKYLISVVLILNGFDAVVYDLTNICEYHAFGEMVRNPINCNSYIICSKIPIVRYCDNGLHYDAERKICNWPAFVECEIDKNIPTVSTDVVTPIKPTQPNMPSSPATEPEWIWENEPHPIFISIDVETGLEIDPMSKYNPQHVECHHFGAYFLPHPQECRKYFMCTYGHLHQHHCGRGTLWNYMRQQCEVSTEAECYHKTDDELSESVISMITINSTTICYNIEITSTTVDSINTNTTIWRPTGTPKMTTITAVTRPTPASTPRVDNGTVHPVKCPSGNGAAYLPHPNDCSKYYICIVGMPVLTTCPEGLYWDQKAEFCDLAKNVDCKQKELN